MIAAEQRSSPRVLLVDDDDAVRDMMTLALKGQGFEVVAAASVTEALKQITMGYFDALITDLHMPHAGDGFTLITAMRHSQPHALTLLLSGYPDIQGAMEAILLEADHIIAKPVDIGTVAGLVREKLLSRTVTSPLRRERVATILQRSVANIVASWLTRSKQIAALRALALPDDERTGHLPKLVEDLVSRLERGASAITGSETSDSLSALTHGELRHRQGYTPAMLVQESRILQVTIFETLQKNRDLLDFSVLLPDVMMIADEVDSQLTQSMSGYMKVMQLPEVA